MKYFFSAVLLLIFISGTALAQSIKGKITNQSGEAIPYATIYIQELRQGTTSNSKGDYELNLEPGSYEVTYQSLGYEPVYEKISVSNKEIIRNIVLPVQYYQIPEVRISASGEDPAYIIMRKVIGMAPYYLNNVSFYKAEVYLKGNLLIKKIPKILQKSMQMQSKGTSAKISGGGKARENVIKEGDSFFMESYNEIEFNAPDKYHQKVVSYNSTFPEEGNEISPMSFIQASFYEPVIAEIAISPLSPAAFSHYNFKYIGSSLQGMYTINKIQVTPKRKSQQLFTGTIFIIEDLWCLHSIDLENENLVGKIRIQQLYVPVQDDIWMPVSHKFDVDISIMGFRGEAGYGSSVKYLQVKPNLALKKPETASTNYTGRQTINPTDTLPPSKARKEISKILEKDEMSNRDMVRLSRLMEKESQKIDTSRKSLEIKDATTQVVDKDAGKKDSAYWAEIRPIPLSELEKKSIRVSDSIKSQNYSKKLEADTTSRNDTVAVNPTKKNKFGSALKHIATGYTWNDTIGNSINFGGFFKPKSLSFNTVDGFIYGINGRYSRSRKGKMFSLSPEVKWAFGRQEPMWKVNGFYRFDKLKASQVYFRLGQTSIDINNGGGINLFLNTSFSLILKKNHLKLYESGYFTLGYKSNISTSLSLDIAATYEDRRTLENSTSYSLFKSSRQYTENVPVNAFLLPGQNPFYALRDMRHADIMTRLTYIPFQRYRMYNGNRIPAGSDWPTFTFTWQHGINEFSELENPIRHIDMLRLEVDKTKDLGAFSEISWRARTGGFIKNKYVTFYDFYHVNSQPLPFLLNSYGDAFMLPAFYSMSTPDFFVQGHVKYTTPYLLIKLLPVISKTLMRENVSVSYIGSDLFRKNYTELGYSLSEIFFFAELGVYVGFDDLKYRTAGVSLTLKFN